MIADICRSFQIRGGTGRRRTRSLQKKDNSPYTDGEKAVDQTGVRSQDLIRVKDT